MFTNGGMMVVVFLIRNIVITAIFEAPELYKSSRIQFGIENNLAVHSPDNHVTYKNVLLIILSLSPTTHKSTQNSSPLV